MTSKVPGNITGSRSHLRGDTPRLLLQRHLAIYCTVWKEMDQQQASLYLINQLCLHLGRVITQFEVQ